jgi:hypothetical protein
VRSRIHTSAPGATRAPALWRGAFRRHLTLLLAAKLVALALLWALFFSPAHRTPVDDQAAAQRLALAHASTHD